MKRGITHWLLGKARNPLSKRSRQHIVLIAFLAWVGLGADGLSSANYGPEQAFIALGTHHILAFYLALMTSVTIFLISMAYGQIIRLFPNGGGGYKVASTLLGEKAGLVSGAALIIDYVLTIVTSIASGTDALFSLFPESLMGMKLYVEIVVLLFLVVMNLRGAKESIQILLPVFLGFFITHIIIIVYGCLIKTGHTSGIMHAVGHETGSVIQSLGWFGFLALFMRAYSLGGGTYTGLEAVSNNVRILKEPRVRTGMWTMFYMAISLSCVASGIIFLYLFWNPMPQADRTLNAIVFEHILSGANPYISNFFLMILLLTEAGILYVAANTGFLGGPAILANMAMDHWMPKKFGLLSSRLVTQNGVILFGLSALFLLLATHGVVSFLVILYSMNVFITFSMSLLGLCIYWLRHQEWTARWFMHFIFSVVALMVCVIILFSTLLIKFGSGGWITVLITSAVVALGLCIRRHYRYFDRLKTELNHSLYVPLPKNIAHIPIDPQKPTAVFLVSELGSAMHAVLWVHRMFPKHFYNHIFVGHGEIDTENFGSSHALKVLQEATRNRLRYLVSYVNQQGFAATTYESFGADPVDHIERMVLSINRSNPDSIYFASRYIYPNENWFVRLLHSDMTTILQRRLQPSGVKMLILPLKL